MHMGASACQTSDPENTEMTRLDRPGLCGGCVVTLRRPPAWWCDCSGGPRR